LIKAGLLKSLLITSVTPLRVPVADGVKVVETVQVAPGRRDVGQLLLEEKSPVAETVPSTRLCVVEGFLIVEVWGGLVVPTDWPAKVSLTGFSEID
jgi:hypothetical protein